MSKNGILNYVLVVDVSQDAGLFYYTGLFVPLIKDREVLTYHPLNTPAYDGAMKLIFSDEAQKLCALINSIPNCPFKYHVEEHAYQDKIG